MRTRVACSTKGLNTPKGPFFPGRQDDRHGRTTGRRPGDHGRFHVLLPDRWASHGRYADEVVAVGRRYEHELLADFETVSRAVVMATLLSALAQGLLAGIGYWIGRIALGVPAA